MGTQDIALIVIASVIALIYIASRILEEDCKRLEKEQKREAK